ncbi:ABC transporter permease [Patiriisocius sp. Uisw_047]|jgi:lipopolysaccharide transport system permease protein|uniref:ABC transporter permease n=1 Tax=Patiriisocius sp. Uisw_047 TaxID=3230969 RepID=UPI0039E9A620
MSLPIKVYQRENNHNLFKLLKESLSDMGSSFFLAKQLATRDIKAQYRQSYLGILWAFITPLAIGLVWIFLNKSGTVAISDTGMPYPVFVFTGTIIWSIIVESINSPITTTNGARGILSKINFPKEALLVSGVLKLLFNSIIKIVLLLAFLLFFGVSYQWSLLYFPFILVGGVFFGTVCGLFITPIGMLYSDVARIISLGLRFVMYAAPVVYAVPKEIGFFRNVMMWNPITPIITTARDTIVGAEFTMLPYFLIVLAVCIPLFMLGLVFYRVSIPIIVERLSA